MKFLSLFIPVGFLSVLVGCGTHNEKNIENEVVIVEKQFVQIKPVTRDVTTQRIGTEQAGAAVAEGAYSIVLAKKKYGVMSNETKSATAEQNTKEKKQKSVTTAAENNSVSETKSTKTNKKDMSIYNKR